MSGREGSLPLRHKDFLRGPVGRVAGAALLVSLFGVVACRRHDGDAPRTSAPPAPAPSPRAGRPPRGPDADALPPATGLPPERRALQVVDGHDRIVDADVA